MLTLPFGHDYFAIHRHQKTHFDKRAIPVPFEEGDLVCLLITQLSTNWCELSSACHLAPLAYCATYACKAAQAICCTATASAVGPREFAGSAKDVGNCWQC